MKRLGVSLRTVSVMTGLWLCLAGTCLTGCEFDDDDDKNFDHVSPAGQGAIIVDNETTDHISVFFDGRVQPDAREDENPAYDLDPGVYRVVLEQQGGRSNFRGDIDVVEGRTTVLEVFEEFGSGYDVRIFFD